MRVILLLIACVFLLNGCKTFAPGQTKKVTGCHPGKAKGHYKNPGKNR